MWQSIGSNLMGGLYALLTASEDQLIQFPASFFVSGLMMRRQRREPIELFDFIAVAVVVLAIGFLVRRMYRSPVRSLAGKGRFYKIREGTVGPNVAWAHFLYDGLWIWMGIELWTGITATPNGPIEELSIGPGLVIVASLLIVVRVFCLIKHRDSPENI